MELDIRRSAASFFVPGGLVLAVTALMLRRGVLVPDAQFADFCWYAAFGISLLLALRFHSIRLCFTLIALGLASIAPEHLTGHVVVSAVAYLIPINLVLFSTMEDKGFTRFELGIRGAIFFAQFITIAFLSRPELASTASVLDYVYVRSLSKTVPQLALVIFVAACGVFLARYWLYRKQIEAGYFWATAAAMLSAHNAGTPTGKFYVAVSAGMLGLSMIEGSYRMAYHDELTGLPARRAFNDALLRLGEKFALAVVDIDHFKNFNDTYGHDTGDQVLRMVASKLARVSGGGEAFRLGGEEFCILFPNRTVRDALPYLERLRQEIADTPFILRGPDRDARTVEDRLPSNAPPKNSTHVTVSLGVAGTNGKALALDEALRAADKALYKAKQNGRNRTEVANPGRKVLPIAPAHKSEPYAPDASAPFR